MEKKKKLSHNRLKKSFFVQLESKTSNLEFLLGSYFVFPYCPIFVARSRKKLGSRSTTMHHNYGFQLFYFCFHRIWSTTLISYSSINFFFKKRLPTTKLLPQLRKENFYISHLLKLNCGNFRISFVELKEFSIEWKMILHQQVKEKVNFFVLTFDTNSNCVAVSEEG